MQPLLAALNDLGLASGIARSAIVYALVSAAHVTGIALTFGGILAVDLGLVGLIRPLDQRAIRVLRRIAAAGLVLALATGVLLFSARPHEYAMKPVVWLKLAVVALAILNALTLGRAALAGTGRPVLAGTVSILAWLSVIGLGRWIAFT